MFIYFFKLQRHKHNNVVHKCVYRSAFNVSDYPTNWRHWVVTTIATRVNSTKVPDHEIVAHQHCVHVTRLSVETSKYMSKFMIVFFFDLQRHKQNNRVHKCVYRSAFHVSDFPMNWRHWVVTSIATHGHSTKVPNNKIVANQNTEHVLVCH